MTSVRVYIHGAVKCTQCKKQPVFIATEEGVDVAECSDSMCNPVIFREPVSLETAMLQWNGLNICSETEACSD